MTSLPFTIILFTIFLRLAAYGSCLGRQWYIADSWNPGIRGYSVAGTASASLSLPIAVFEICLH